MLLPPLCRLGARRAGGRTARCAQGLPRLPARRAAAAAAPGGLAQAAGRAGTAAAGSALERLLARHGPEGIVAPSGFSRWWVPPAAISFHLCLGSVYAWSILNAPLCRAVGVVSSSAADWTLGGVVPIFSTAIFFLGASAAVAGRHIDRFGPRIFGLASAVLWGGGHLVSAAGVKMHCLPLLYLGYGVMGGVGLGLGYLAPVGLLLSWFPERRGMATGMAIMGFGGGAVVFAPAMEALLRLFRAPPALAGPPGCPGQWLDAAGVWRLDVGGRAAEVLAPSAQELAAFPGLGEGLYLAGTGCSGVAEALACLGAGYFLVMAPAALAWRVPAGAARPPGGPAPAAGGPAAPRPAPGVSLDTAMRSPQFYCLWLNLCLNTTAGIGMIGVAKDMMSEIFGSALPSLVTAEFAASYVLAVSLANMGGRFFWATVSDAIGRKNAYYVYFSLGAPLYLSLPCWATMTDSSPELALGLFCASTMVTFSTYGAGFSTMPAYVADVFGTRNVSSIFGRVLTAWSAAGVLGPLAITQLRARAERAAAVELAEQIGHDRFAEVFRAPLGDLDALLASRAVTLQRLLKEAPPGAVDPTPHVYDEVMLCMAGLQALAILSNRCISPHPALALSAPADPGGRGADGEGSAGGKPGHAGAR